MHNLFNKYLQIDQENRRYNGSKMPTLKSAAYFQLFNKNMIRVQEKGQDKPRQQNWNLPRVVGCRNQLRHMYNPLSISVLGAQYRMSILRIPNQYALLIVLILTWRLTYEEFDPKCILQIALKSAVVIILNAPSLNYSLHYSNNTFVVLLSPKGQPTRIRKS